MKKDQPLWIPITKQTKKSPCPIFNTFAKYYSYVCLTNATPSPQQTTLPISSFVWCLQRNHESNNDGIISFQILPRPDLSLQTLGESQTAVGASLAQADRKDASFGTPRHDRIYTTR